MTLYLDTSVLVSALTNETGTARVQAWLAAQDMRACAVSAWVVTEFSSALAIKLRSGRISPPLRAEALATFSRLVNETLSVLAMRPDQFHAAARFADQHELGLRSGDALHLAVAADHGATLCTLDRRLGAAGAALGISTRVL